MAMKFRKLTMFSTIFLLQSGGKSRKALHVPYRDSVLTWLLKVTPHFLHFKQFSLFAEFRRPISIFQNSAVNNRP